MALHILLPSFCFVLIVSMPNSSFLVMSQLWCCDAVLSVNMHEICMFIEILIVLN
jgi:hypothetical protein